jgi:hypothetical protein
MARIFEPQRWNAGLPSQNFPVLAFVCYLSSQSKPLWLLCFEVPVGAPQLGAGLSSVGGASNWRAVGFAKLLLKRTYHRKSGDRGMGANIDMPQRYFLS